MNYRIYANTGAGDPIDYSTPIGTTTGLTFDTDALAYPGDWRFAVRADDGTTEEINADAAVRLALDAAGMDVTGLPSAPVGLTAWPIAGGGVRVVWSYPRRSTAGVAGFRVYAGIGSPDYGTVKATVSALGMARAFQADVAGLAGGTTYVFAVRAFNAIGEEANAATTAATAKATGPGAVVGLAISTDPGGW